MPSSIIDSKSKVTKIAAGLEKLTVTLTLLETNPKVFGISYQIQYSGVQSGNAGGGPIEIKGNLTQTVSDDPKVTCTISDYSVSEFKISMHIIIIADLPKVGPKTIFDDILGGPYGANPLHLILKHLAELFK